MTNLFKKVNSRVIGVLLVIVPLYVCGTFKHDLWRPAEAREAGIAREMIENGNWAATYLNGQPFIEKPPLYTWLIAGPLLIFGYQDWAVRVFVLIFALASLMALYGLARQMFSERVAQISAVAMATMALFLEVNHGAMVDNGLIFFITAGMWAAYNVLEAELPATRSRAAFLFAVLAGLAFLCKGAIGIVLMGGALLGYIVQTKQWRKIAGFLTVGAILGFIVITGSWLIALWLRGGKEYFNIFFYQNHFQRLVGTFEPTKARWYYLPYIFLVALPWTFLIPFGMRLKLKRSKTSVRSRKSALFLLWWVIAMFVILNLAGGKGHQYLLPLLPPLAIFAAIWVEETIRGKMPGGKAALYALYAFTAVVTVIGIALPAAAFFIEGNRFVAALLLTLVIVTVFFVWRNASCQRWQKMWRSLAALAVLLALTFGAAWEPYLNRQKTMVPLAEFLNEQLPPGSKLWGYDLTENSAGALIFYGCPIHAFDGYEKIGAEDYIILDPSVKRITEKQKILPAEWQEVLRKECAGRIFILLQKHKSASTV